MKKMIGIAVFSLITGFTSIRAQSIEIERVDILQTVSGMEALHGVEAVLMFYNQYPEPEWMFRVDKELKDLPYSTASYHWKDAGTMQKMTVLKNKEDVIALLLNGLKEQDAYIHQLEKDMQQMREELDSLKKMFDIFINAMGTGNLDLGK
jgi:hypothetical protein